MTKTATALALVAVAALAGCNKTPTTVNDMSGTDNNVAVNADVAASMPPAIVASKIYRCKDNSLVYIDWLAGDTTANLRTTQGGSPTQLTAAAKGDALKADGYALIGSPTAKTVTLTRPDKGEQACKA